MLTWQLSPPVIVSRFVIGLQKFSDLLHLSSFPPISFVIKERREIYAMTYFELVSFLVDILFA